MTIDEAFMADIVAHPESDAPRLIYADWLDDNAGREWCRLCGGEGRIRSWGESSRCGRCCGRRWQSDGRRERAEFIRVQCELARLGPVGQSASDMRIGGPVQVLRRRERELFRDLRGFLPREFDAYITAGTPEDLGGKPGAGVRRGFVESVACTLADWLEHGPAIAQKHPVTEVRLSDRVLSHVLLGGGWRWWFPSLSDTSVVAVSSRDILWDGRHGDMTEWCFPTRAAAEKALSDRCVAWARAEFGRRRQPTAPARTP